MIKTLTNLFKQDKEKFVVPKGVQDVIPVAAIFDDGIFKVGKDKYSKTYRFTDINYAVASREDKEAMFLEYSELLNSLDSGATTKITINNLPDIPALKVLRCSCDECPYFRQFFIPSFKGIFKILNYPVITHSKHLLTIKGCPLTWHTPR